MRRLLITTAGVVAMVAVVGCGNPDPVAPSPSTITSAGPTTTVIFTGPTQGAQVGVPTATTSPGGDDAIPVAATLAWLSGRSPADGVEIKVADGTRWQGTEAGTYAVITAAGYRWFGADGSAVGCRKSGRCVGIDRDGNTAVVLSAGGDRFVYNPSGAFRGRFDPVGRLVAGGSPGSLEGELKASGVDVARLLDEATRPVPFAGGVTGDPHVLTAGGARVTSQAIGDFVARAGDVDRPLQFRVEPMPHRTDVAIVTAAALLVADSRVVFTSSGRLTVDGGLAAADGAGFTQLSVIGGPEIGRWGPDADKVSHLAVVWPDGGTVVMTGNVALGMTVVAMLPERAGVTGLFGTGHGADSLLDRRGLPIAPADAADAWQLYSADVSLFNDPFVPVAGFPSSAAVPPDNAAAASAASCRSAGVAQVPDLTACVFDVSITGDDGFTAGHAAMVIPATRLSAPAGLSARWPALVRGAVDLAAELPGGGLVETELAPGDHLLYQVDVAQDQVITAQFVRGCSADRVPGLGQSAVRLFDSTGRAVSDRWALCGQDSTGGLQAGRYYLVADGPLTAPGVPLRVQVGTR